MLAPLNGFDAYYEEHGRGTPLVLVHGLGGSTMSWQRVVVALSESFRVIAYDLRGLGQSGTPPPPYSLAMLVADLHALVQELGLERVALLGHSLGGAVTLAYAAEHPERVTTVVAVAAPSITPVEQRAALRQRARVAEQVGMASIAEIHVLAGMPESFRNRSRDEVSAYESVVAAGDARGYAALCGVLAELDLTDTLGRITAPVLLVQGDLDLIVPASAARATASSIPSCEYVELGGCGHVVPFERPADLVRLVAGFAGRHAGD
jgi:pimeloyl-ACP methyl ester carboxylesterase